MGGGGGIKQLVVRWRDPLRLERAAIFRAELWRKLTNLEIENENENENEQ